MREMFKAGTITSQQAAAMNQLLRDMEEMKRRFAPIVTGPPIFEQFDIKVTAILTGSISDVTNTDPAEITSTAHGLEDGDEIDITGVVGSTGVNGTFVITLIDDDTFSVDVDAGGVYDTGGTWTGRKYSWTEQWYKPDTGQYENRVGGRVGTPAESPAFERNSRTATAFPFYALARARITVNQIKDYEFDMPGDAAVAITFRDGYTRSNLTDDIQLLFATLNDVAPGDPAIWSLKRVQGDDNLASMDPYDAGYVTSGIVNAGTASEAQHFGLGDVFIREVTSERVCFYDQETDSDDRTLAGYRFLAYVDGERARALIEGGGSDETEADPSATFASRYITLALQTGLGVTFCKFDLRYTQADPIQAVAMLTGDAYGINGDIGMTGALTTDLITGDVKVGGVQAKCEGGILVPA